MISVIVRHGVRTSNGTSLACRALEERNTLQSKRRPDPFFDSIDWSFDPRIFVYEVQGKDGHFDRERRVFRKHLSNSPLSNDYITKHVSIFASPNYRS